MVDWTDLDKSCTLSARQAVGIGSQQRVDQARQAIFCFRPAPAALAFTSRFAQLLVDDNLSKPTGISLPASAERLCSSMNCKRSPSLLLKETRRLNASLALLPSRSHVAHLSRRTAAAIHSTYPPAHPLHFPPNHPPYRPHHPALETRLSSRPRLAYNSSSTETGPSLKASRQRMGRGPSGQGRHAAASRAVDLRRWRSAHRAGAGAVEE